MYMQTIAAIWHGNILTFFTDICPWTLSDLINFFLQDTQGISLGYSPVLAGRIKSCDMFRRIIVCEQKIKYLRVYKE